MGDIDLPSGTTAPLYGSGDLATLGLGEPPPSPLPTRLYKLASRRARVFVVLWSGYAESSCLRLRRLMLRLWPSPSQRLLRATILSASSSGARLRALQSLTTSTSSATPSRIFYYVVSGPRVLLPSSTLTTSDGSARESIRPSLPEAVEVGHWWEVDRTVMFGAAPSLA